MGSCGRNPTDSQVSRLLLSSLFSLSCPPLPVLARDADVIYSSSFLLRRRIGGLLPPTGGLLLLPLSPLSEPNILLLIYTGRSGSSGFAVIFCLVPVIMGKHSSKKKRKTHTD